MEGRFSDRPDRERGNPLKPVRTRDDVGKNLANAIVARFRRIFPTLRGRFPSRYLTHAFFANKDFCHLSPLQNFPFNEKSQIDKG